MPSKETAVPLPGKYAPVVAKSAKQKPQKKIALSSEYVGDSEGSSESDSDTNRNTSSGSSTSGSSSRSRSSRASIDRVRARPKDPSPVESSYASTSSPPAANLHQPSPFKAPPGYRATPISSAGTSDASHLFSEPKLTGKQIFHIVTPRAISIDIVKEIAATTLQKGGFAVHHNDIDYEFKVEQDKRTRLLLPNGSDGLYRLAPDEFVHSLHLQQVLRPIKLEGPHLNGHSDATSSSYSAGVAKKPAVEQPNGLRMRFVPLGVKEMSGYHDKSDQVSTEDTGSEDDTVQETRQFRIPKGFEESPKPRKRKVAHIRNDSDEASRTPLTAQAGHEPVRKKSKHRNVYDSSSQASPMDHVVSNGLDSISVIPSSQPLEREKRRHKAEEVMPVLAGSEHWSPGGEQSKRSKHHRKKNEYDITSIR